jgi:hypothetical protein
MGMHSLFVHYPSRLASKESNHSCFRTTEKIAHLVEMRRYLRRLKDWIVADVVMSASKPESEDSFSAYQKIPTKDVFDTFVTVY